MYVFLLREKNVQYFHRASKRSEEEARDTRFLQGVMHVPFGPLIDTARPLLCLQLKGFNDVNLSDETTCCETSLCGKDHVWSKPRIDSRAVKEYPV